MKKFLLPRSGLLWAVATHASTKSATIFGKLTNLATEAKTQLFEINHKPYHNYNIGACEVNKDDYFRLKFDGAQSILYRIPVLPTIIPVSWQIYYSTQAAFSLQRICGARH